MILRNYYFIFLSFFATSLYSFDVKVLLCKKKQTEKEKTTISLQSSTGFIISEHPVLSFGKQIASESVKIRSEKKDFSLLKKSLPIKTIYITPALSKQHRVALYEYVSIWLKQYYEKCKGEDEKSLYPLFDQLVSKKQSETVEKEGYQLLQKKIQELFHDYLFSFLDDIEVPVISLQTVREYADNFLYAQIRPLFLQKIIDVQLSKNDRKRLQQDQVYRYHFFAKIVKKVSKELLQQFVLSLPRKLLKQFLKQEVGHLSFGGYPYLGTFIVQKKDEVVYLVNSLDIDDYLLSVIRYEGWPGWPLEVNKVQAIACRTYLIHQILQADRKKRLYHIENGIRHQTYKGHHGQVRLQRAVDETRDMFVGYQGKPIVAMFDTCCGGIIPSDIDEVISYAKKYPYLSRKKYCSFCLSCKTSRWHKEYNEEELLQLFKKDIPELSNIVSFEVESKDKAGLVKEVLLVDDSGKKFKITGNKMYSIFSDIKSFCFDIKKSGNKKYQFLGKGYGHHIGLCQWGAMKLVKDEHWNYKQILQFYYPGTTIMKLGYQR